MLFLQQAAPRRIIKYTLLGSFPRVRKALHAKYQKQQLELDFKQLLKKDRDDGELKPYTMLN
jgi:hypothetical protein